MTWIPPACAHRHLMDINTFEENFRDHLAHKTYLCYQLKDDAGAPVQECQGFLRNQVRAQQAGPGTRGEGCHGLGVSSEQCPLGSQLL